MDPSTARATASGSSTTPTRAPVMLVPPRCARALSIGLSRSGSCALNPASSMPAMGALQRNLSAQVDRAHPLGSRGHGRLAAGPGAGGGAPDWHVLDLPAIAEHPADRPHYPAHGDAGARLAAARRGTLPRAFPPAGAAEDPCTAPAVSGGRPSTSSGLAPVTGGIFQRSWIRAPLCAPRQRATGPPALRAADPLLRSHLQGSRTTAVTAASC